MRVSLVAHDIRSTHNVGAFFRTADALGIEEIIFSGYTPYPTLADDTRLPHFSDKITRQIHKTALGAESSVEFRRFETIDEVVEHLQESDTTIVALEQAPGSYSPLEVRSKLEHSKISKVALIVGNEIHGVHQVALSKADFIMEIPMRGIKESLNVSVATGIALYALSL